jgi:hypothetical protein
MCTILAVSTNGSRFAAFVHTGGRPADGAARLALAAFWWSVAFTTRALVPVFLLPGQRERARDQH